MPFENIQFKCIKGIPINSVETRMLSEMGFPVDVPTQPDMSHSIAFYNYVSKVSEYPFPLLRLTAKAAQCEEFPLPLKPYRPHKPKQNILTVSDS